MRPDNIPVGFGLAMSGNTAAMNHYSHLSEPQRQAILKKAHDLHTKEEMYTLVATLANGSPL